MYYLHVFIMRQVICWFVYIGKIPGLRGFLDSNLQARLAIVTENDLWLAFPPRNLPKKFRPDPSTFYLVIVVTNRQTCRQTNAGDYIIPRESFRGDNNNNCVCGKAVDARGLHGLSCRRSAPRQQRHSHLNDILWRAIKRAQMPAVKESQST